MTNNLTDKAAHLLSYLHDLISHTQRVTGCSPQYLTLALRMTLSAEKKLSKTCKLFVYVTVVYCLANVRYHEIVLLNITNSEPTSK